MIRPPSVSSLFHELFKTEWPQDDPEFIEEIKKYESVIRRLLTLDDQLSHYIKLQPLMDNDQLASLPIYIKMQKIELNTSLQTYSKDINQIEFQFNTSPINISDVFSEVTVDVGTHLFQYNGTDQATDSIRATFESAENQTVNVKCCWKCPLLKLSSPLQKIVGSPYSISSVISQKVLSHIDSKNLFSNGEVKCDNILKSLSGLDTFHITSLSDIISQNFHPIDDFHFTLDNIQSSRSFSIQAPVLSTIDSQFIPSKVPPAPIREFLEASISSKRQLIALDEFVKEPLPFVEEMVLEEARQTPTDEIANSSFFFLEPWVSDTASDYLKAAEYKKRYAQKRPQNNQPYKQ
ncbi:hypothetical protein GPJ56_005118 [Histomonas meleagridis]|uniref:uncharacterized protein n=1 Tax=Histomonas meleagridis TaxID=135588 RepID=UPI00355A57FA|nr:hypothetical protein GPJ56_005118 [Histomonas meleagridis]KAH0802635.1 hypothetical protein GO595_004684 [Histomonas meleagridis]